MRPILLHGHERAITYIKYSPDGDVFFSAAKDFTPMMWRATDGERLGVFEGHSGAVFQLDITSDTKYLFSACMDSSTNIWEVNTGKRVNTLRLPYPVRCVSVSEGDKYLCCCTLSFASSPVMIYIYDLNGDLSTIEKPDTVIMNICPTSVNITSIVWSALNEKLILGCTDGYIRIVDMTQGKVVQSLHPHELEITSLIASYDRTMIATASKDAKTKLFDIQTMEEICSFHTDRPLNSVALSPILNHMVVVGGVEARDVTTSRAQKMESIFFNTALQEEIGRVKGSFGTMNCVQFNPDGKSFITGGEDGYVRLCFFDEDYFHKDEKEEKRLRDIDEKYKQSQ